MQKRSCRIGFLPLAASIAALLTVSADAAATTYNWFNVGSDWGTGSDWSPLGPPTSADTASFNPRFGSGSAIVNPDIEGSQAAFGLNINNNILGGTYTFTSNNPGGGTLTLGTGGVVVRGFGTQVINGPILAGAAAGNLAFNVGMDSGLTLAGATTALTNAGAVTINGGAFTLDNTSNATAKLVGNAIVVNSSGTFSIIGNSSATTYNLGAFDGTGNTFSGLDVVSVTPNGAPVVVNFANPAGSMRPGTRSASEFVATSGNLGDATGARIFFNGTPFLGAGSLLSTTSSTTAQGVGFALVKDALGTNWATYSATAGIVSVANSTFAPSAAAPVTAVTATDLQNSTNVQNTQFNPVAGVMVSPTQLVAASLRITPAGSGATLAMGTTTLTTNALMLDGTNDFAITGTGSYLGGGTRYIYVDNANATLSISLVVDSGTNPTVFGGPGTIELTGTASQNTNTDTSRFSIAGGVVRANDTQVGFGTATNRGVISFGGGVLEIKNGSNGTGSTADFTRNLGTVAGNVTWGGTGAEAGSGGFSAFGAPASVNLGGASSQVIWNNTASFVGDGYALMFGSIKSNATLTFLNPIGLDAGTAGTYAEREIKVTQGAGTAVDKTTLAGVVSGSTSSDLLKTGTGVLELNQANTYQGNTLVQNGTLLVTNSTGSATGTGSALIESGATLAGTGTVGAVTLQLGGKLAPGNLLSTTPATLSASGLVWNGGSTLVFDLSTTSNASDLLALSGALTQGVAGVYTFDFDAGGKGGQTYNLITYNATTFANPTLFSATDLAPGVTGSFQFGAGASANTLQFVTAAVLPEPSAALTILCGISMLSVFGRFRRSLC